MNKAEKIKRWKSHGTIGILLVIIFWYLNWNLEGLRTDWAFFPLWLGFILTIDAIVFYRKGSSLLNRNYFYFVILFLISIPGWWLFELFNLRMQNWSYIGREHFTSLQYFLLASLSFSTVMPAVFESAELISTFHSYKKVNKRNTTSLNDSILIKFFFTGFVIIILILMLPNIFYPLIWIALFFIIDPINYKLGNRSLLNIFFNRNRRQLYSLALGCLLCAFFWEMWNYYSYPKWVYKLPMVNFFHVFEMPVLGYIGYIPFSLELFALYQLIVGFINPKMKNYIEI